MVAKYAHPEEAPYWFALRIVAPALADLQAKAIDVSSSFFLNKIWDICACAIFGTANAGLGAALESINKRKGGPA
jgi:hypothetical protein